MPCGDNAGIAGEFVSYFVGLRKGFSFLAGSVAIFFVFLTSGCGGSSPGAAEVSAPKEDLVTTDSSSIEEPGASLNDDQFLGEYEMIDPIFGTDITVRFENNSRIITSNSLPNHETGDFPNENNPNTISAQDNLWSFPLNPVFTGEPQPAYVVGVAVNGVKFEPGTDEKVICESGEVYPVEGLQDVVELGMDLNNAHVQPTGEYHYHGISDLLVEILSSDGDLVHVGFARDGHLIYFSDSSNYSPSFLLGTGVRSGSECFYTPGRGEPLKFGLEKDGSLTADWEFDASHGELDQCNGAVVNGGYAYFVTRSFPFFPRCLMGEFEAEARGPASADQAPPPDGQAPPPGQKGPPPGE